MDVFLKEILEPSEQDVFDDLTRMETLSSDTFSSPCAEYLPPSANVGLPSHLIQCHRPWPAYTTHTAPVVKMLVEQDERRKAASNRPAETETNREPQEAEEVTQVPKLSRGSSTHGMGKDFVGMSTAESSLPSPSVCNRVIFARKPPLRVLPSSSLACSSKKK
ncbi:CMT1A duplicated region transcript 4 protein [Falco naumanni]|uniref:CMT1A duplicated region transcript 4 protein n=1 Tax=Falco naumanni TaxID=148594 RepID=UPI001ADDF637|nr:CMT1A duplicated region transcript 4 protein [Falco naumanni]